MSTRSEMWAIIRHQFTFSGVLRRHWGVLAILVVVPFVLVMSPGWYKSIKQAQARPYCERINRELAADNRFREVHASTNLKYIYSAISFDGPVRSDEDLRALMEVIRDSRPPAEYSMGVWVDPKKR